MITSLTDGQWFIDYIHCKTVYLSVFSDKFKQLSLYMDRMSHLCQQIYAKLSVSNSYNLYTLLLAQTHMPVSGY